jgi:hypothetical protein
LNPFKNFGMIIPRRSSSTAVVSMRRSATPF